MAESARKRPPGRRFRRGGGRDLLSRFASTTFLAAICLRPQIHDVNVFARHAVSEDVGEKPQPQNVYGRQLRKCAGLFYCNSEYPICAAELPDENSVHCISLAAWTSLSFGAPAKKSPVLLSSTPWTTSRIECGAVHGDALSPRHFVAQTAHGIHTLVRMYSLIGSISCKPPRKTLFLLASVFFINFREHLMAVDRGRRSSLKVSSTTLAAKKKNRATGGPPLSSRCVARASDPARKLQLSEVFSRLRRERGWTAAGIPDASDLYNIVDRRAEKEVLFSGDIDDVEDGVDAPEAPSMDEYNFLEVSGAAQQHVGTARTGEVFSRLHRDERAEKEVLFSGDVNDVEDDVDAPETPSMDEYNFLEVSGAAQQHVGTARTGATRQRHVLAPHQKSSGHASASTDPSHRQQQWDAGFVKKGRTERQDDPCTCLLVLAGVSLVVFLVMCCCIRSGMRPIAAAATAPAAVDTAAYGQREEDKEHKYYGEPGGDEYSPEKEAHYYNDDDGGGAGAGSAGATGVATTARKNKKNDDPDPEARIKVVGM